MSVFRIVMGIISYIATYLALIIKPNSYETISRKEKMFLYSSTIVAIILGSIFCIWSWIELIKNFTLINLGVIISFMISEGILLGDVPSIQVVISAIFIAMMIIAFILLMFLQGCYHTII